MRRFHKVVAEGNPRLALSPLASALSVWTNTSYKQKIRHINSLNVNGTIICPVWA